MYGTCLLTDPTSSEYRMWSAYYRTTKRTASLVVAAANPRRVAVVRWFVAERKDYSVHSVDCAAHRWMGTIPLSTYRANSTLMANGWMNASTAETASS